MKIKRNALERGFWFWAVLCAAGLQLLHLLAVGILQLVGVSAFLDPASNLVSALLLLLGFLVMLPSKGRAPRWARGLLGAAMACEVILAALFLAAIAALLKTM